MTTKQITREEQEFFRNTWNVWRTGGLEPYRTNYSVISKLLSFDEFITSDYYDMSAVIDIFFTNFKPQPNEFLIDFDTPTRGAQSLHEYILTSNRIILYNHKRNVYAAINLSEIKSFHKRKGLSAFTYTFITLTKDRVFDGVSHSYDDDLLGFAIDQARENPPWHYITEKLELGVDQETTKAITPEKSAALILEAEIAMLEAEIAMSADDNLKSDISTETSGTLTDSDKNHREVFKPIRFLFYALVRFFEATLLYFLAFFLLQLLETTIPPIGSKAFIMFVIIWPFVAHIVQPGLQRIPIIGDVFSAINSIALSTIGRKEQNKDS